MEMFDNQLWTKDKTEPQHMHASYISKGKAPFPQKPAGLGCSKTDSAIQRINHYPVDMY